MSSDLRPILIFGGALVGCGLLCACLFLGPTVFNPYWENPSARPAFIHYSLLSVTAFYTLTGVGVLLRTKWGYLLLKTLLYLMIVAFPIGTVISWLTLSYMRRHQVGRHFGFRQPA